MYRQKHKRIARIGVFIATGVALLIATLWSWNTLVELFGGPAAQIKHIAAAAIILAVFRWAVTPRSTHYRRRHKSIAVSGAEKPADG